jgi:hypothetical protein
MLPDTPIVRNVLEILQMLNAPQEWDVYLEEKFWTLGQTILWLLTRDPWVVDQASNDTGDQGESFGEIKAAILIDLLNLGREDVQDAAKKLRRRCLNGLPAINGQDRPIPEIEWRHLKIVLQSDNTPSIVRRGQSSIVLAYPDVVFARVEVLREFPPEGRSDQDVNAPPPGAEAIEPASQDAAVEAEPSSIPAPEAPGTAENDIQIRILGRHLLEERPLHKKHRTSTVVTAAWDVMRLHEEWATHGIPAHWSEQVMGEKVTEHFKNLIRQSRIDPQAYPLKTDLKGYLITEISGDSVQRALVPRGDAPRQSGSSAGN